MFTRYTLIAVALLVGAASAHGQGVQSKGSTPGPKIITTREGLSVQFRRLAATATAPKATIAQRQAMVSFVRAELVPQLANESWQLYTTFDSLVGGAYAVPATLFDLDAIAYLITEVERTAPLANRSAFEARTYALGMSLEGYFTKTQTLVLPVMNNWMNGSALTSVLLGSTEKTTSPSRGK